MKIKTISAREVLDSRGNPTVEADVILESGILGRAMVPSGASTGTHEAHELRDGDKKRYRGKGVQKAVGHVRTEIARALAGTMIEDQQKIDTALCELDGTKDKSRLGANAILGVSLAFAHAAAKERDTSLYAYIGSLSRLKRPFGLPMPQCNIINGGAHTNWESTDIQEFMIMPVGAPTFSEGVRMMSEMFHALKSVLQSKRFATSVGDEGGFAPAVQEGNKEALQLIQEATAEAGYQIGKDIVFALDVAASELYTDGAYNLTIEKKRFSSAQLIDFYAALAREFPIRSIEDGLSEEDWSGWEAVTASLGSEVQIVGDDFLVTNVERLTQAIARKAGNAILIKPNQIGTLSETIAAVDTAHEAGWQTVISHRSGETEDTTIAHLAVGLGASQIKTGSMSRSERIAKYNELLRIEAELENPAVAHPHFGM